MSAKKKTDRKLAVALCVLAVGAMLLAGYYYETFRKSNVRIDDSLENAGETAVLKIYHDYDFEDLCNAVDSCESIVNKRSFFRAARSMKLTGGFKAGYYRLKEGMNNKAIVRMIANGWQTPVSISFAGYIRTLDRFAKILSEKLEADSASFAAVLTDPAVMAGYGFEQESFIGMFIPNTYEVYWTISPEKFVDRMNKEYKAFWNGERSAKAAETGLSPKEVSTLASIVISETKHVPEMPRIAGVYMNRLHKGMLLQADPTVVYACNQAGITRVLNKHLKVDSPYNTYIHKGLPPGPITMSPVVALDAVLNYEHNNYLYFCARETFDGQHNFSSTLSGHMANARAYHKALNARSKK